MCTVNAPHLFMLVTGCHAKHMLITSNGTPPKTSIALSNIVLSYRKIKT